MDHRDRIATYGTYLSALPDLSVNIDKMIATFQAEVDLDPPPPREHSTLEKVGKRIDHKVVNVADRLLTILFDKGYIKKDSYHGDMHRHWPGPPPSNWDLKTGKSWTFKRVLEDSREKKTLGHFFHLYLRVKEGQISWHTKQRMPHEAMFDARIGPRHRRKDEGHDQFMPHVRVVLSKDTPRAYLGEEGFRIKLTLSSASRVGDFLPSGELNFQVLGRAINKKVFGETTDSDRKKVLLQWLRPHKYDETQWPNAPLSLIRKAEEELGGWVRGLLEPLPVEHTIHLKWNVCPTCNGRGSHVNPSVDAHGISREEFDEDPDFEDEYRAGRYDVSCFECGGRTTSLCIDEDRTNKETLKVANEIFRDQDNYIREVEAERRMGA